MDVKSKCVFCDRWFPTRQPIGIYVCKDCAKQKPSTEVRDK